MADVLNRSGPSALANGTSTFLTVTALHTYGIKSQRIVNNTASAVTIKIGIGGVADANLILPATIIPPNSVLHDDGFFVLLTGETLQVNTSGTGLELTVSYLDHS
jgi:hypothetical protein